MPGRVLAAVQAEAGSVVRAGHHEVALLLNRLRVSLTWVEILRRTFVDALMKDNCLGMAAQLAYYFFFSLFPAVLFLVALASFFPVARLTDEVVATLGRFAPPEFLEVVTGQLRMVSGDAEGGLLTLGFVAALWSSSTAMTAIIDTLNRAYRVDDGRSWWRVRITAIVLTIGAALFVLASFAIVIVGPQLADVVARALGAGEAVEITGRILEWPLAFLLASIGISLVYYFAPDVEQRWVWLAPGTVFATALWLATSLAFRYYVVNVTHYTETYGALGGAMVLLLWFYLSGFVLLLGAEMNVKIEHAAPAGKDPGEKVAGQGRRISPRAMRAWIRRRRKQHDRPPSTEDVRKVLG
jgi:membrane protein